MIDKRVIKFAGKVKEVDRQYEANNNGELDNGVYHQDDEEAEAEEAKNGEAEKDLEGKTAGGAQHELRQDDDSL